MSGPTTKKQPKQDVFVPHPDDLEHVVAAFAEAERGEGVALTPEEVDRWAETGELPGRVVAWTDERSSSPRAT